MATTVERREVARIVESESFQRGYFFNKFIGRGGFGLVVEGRARTDPSTPIAIKILKNGKGLDTYAKKEIATHGKTINPHIVRFLGVVSYYKYRLTAEAVFLELELMPGGGLHSFLARRKQAGQSIPEKLARLIVLHVSRALSYLHDQRIVHRDIKPANILLDHPDNPNLAKLSDFGVSARLDISVNMALRLQCGTDLYKSPEQLDNTIYAKPVDIWGLGIVAYMLMHQGEHPFYDPIKDKPEDLYSAVREKQLSFDPAVSSLAQDFLSRLLEKDPFKRYAAFEVLKHPWLTGDQTTPIPLKLFDRVRATEVVPHIKQVVML